MIRLLLGFLMIFGVAGSFDTMPEDASYSYDFWLGVTTVIGFWLMWAGVEKIRKQY